MKGAKREFSRLFIELWRKRRWYLAALFLLLTGLCAGCRYRTCLSEHDILLLNEYIDAALLLLRVDGYPGVGGFFYTLLPYLLMYAAVAAACLHPALLPCAAAACVAKGYYFGFFYASLLGSGAAGSIAASLALLPTKLLCAAFLTAACAETGAALRLRPGRMRRVRGRLSPAQSLFAVIKCLGITTALLLLEIILPMRILTV